VSSEFWIGAALSIPIGIAVNLASPAISRGLESRSESAARKRETDRAYRQQTVLEYARDTPSFHAYLLNAVLRTTYIGALFGILGGVLVTAGQALGAVDLYPLETYSFERLFYLLAQIVALMAAILVLTIARNALITIKEVQNARRELPANAKD
jgi:hypothetical protein